MTAMRKSTLAAKPKRIQLSRKKGWRLPPNAVVVSRPSKWGNPYKVHRCNCGSPTCWIVDDTRGEPLENVATRAESIALSVIDFLNWIKYESAGKAMARAAKNELRGKNLACWCPLPKPGQPDICHASVLLEIANEVQP